MSTRRRTMAALLIGFVVLQGCSQFKIRTDYDRAADFGALHTYAWRPRPQLPSGDPRFDNAVIDAPVRAAVERVLGTKGYAKTPGSPDFLVGYHGVVRSKIDVTTVDRTYGYRRVGIGSPRLDVGTYDEGTLLIDVIDPATMKLLWRGSATAVLRQRTSPEKREQRINDAVSEILAKFPPAE